jgi:hypothetical protein
VPSSSCAAYEIFVTRSEHYIKKCIRRVEAPEHHPQCSKDLAAEYSWLAWRDDESQPKVCPDPGPDDPGWQSHSSRSLAYQAQISGLEPGLAINFNGVSFDGCRTEDGPMSGNLLEAKGEGFVWAMVDPNKWQAFYRGVKDAMDQAARQNKAVQGTTRIIEWHFAEEQVANYFRRKFKDAGYDRIVVYSTPFQKIFDTYDLRRLA